MCVQMNALLHSLNGESAQGKRYEHFRERKSTKIWGDSPYTWVSFARLINMGLRVALVGILHLAAVINNLLLLLLLFVFTLNFVYFVQKHEYPKVEHLSLHLLLDCCPRFLTILLRQYIYIVRNVKGNRST